MTRLTTLVLSLLRRLLSSPLVAGSIKRLPFLINAVRRLFTKEKPPHKKDTPHAFSPALSQTSRVNGFPVNDIICPSLQPPSREVDSNYLHASYDHDEPYIHSPIPSKGPILPYANGPQGSRSSQVIGTLTPKERNTDAISMSSQRSAISVISLPMSDHGLTRISSRPDSRNSSRPSLLRPNSRNSQRRSSRTVQPIKVSRAPISAPVNLAHPAGAFPLDYFRPSSPPPLRTVAPMSTATVQRWNRNYIVYVFLICKSLR
jgi:hypothetical protein